LIFEFELLAARQIELWVIMVLTFLAQDLLELAFTLTTPAQASFHFIWFRLLIGRSTGALFLRRTFGIALFGFDTMIFLHLLCIVLPIPANVLIQVLGHFTLKLWVCF